jgi:uncharacterized tellurite resistance protein B-like protein
MEAEQVRRMIERSLADGRLSRQESEAIKAAIYADGKVTPEEVKMFRELQDKIWKGEITIDYD